MANEIDDTSLSATKMELISEIAQRALISNSALLASARDVSAFAGKGMSQISFPKNTSLFAVEKRATGVAGVNQDLVFGKDTMDLDQRAHIQWVVDSDDEIESRLDVQAELIERASKEHARQIDVDLIAEMEAGAIATTTAGAAITQDIVLEMRKVLLTNKADANMLWLAVNPANESNLLKIDPFVSAEKYGSSAIPSGVLGTLYGVKVVMTPELDDDEYFMYASEGLAIGFQRQPMFDEAPKPEFGPGAKLQVLAQKYGVQALQLGVPGGFQADGTTALGAAESAWIVKDNNV
jgi:hypothetical protein